MYVNVFALSQVKWKYIVCTKDKLGYFQEVQNWSCYSILSWNIS